MTTTTVSVSFAPDSQGFTSRACPQCRVRFKIASGQGGSASLAFCPFCRHEGVRWETPEQIKYGKAFAARKVLQPHLDKLDQAFRNLGRAGGGTVRVTGKKPSVDVPPKPVERDSDMPQRFTLTCCGKTIRHEATAQPRYCAICGTAT
jgi:hypothetical protein